jgi:hypothetical protein
MIFNCLVRGLSEGKMAGRNPPSPNTMLARAITVSTEIGGPPLLQTSSVCLNHKPITQWFTGPRVPRF